MSGLRGQRAIFDFQLVLKWRQRLYEPGDRGFRNPVIKVLLSTVFNFFFLYLKFFPHENPITVKNHFRYQARSHFIFSLAYMDAHGRHNFHLRCFSNKLSNLTDHQRNMWLIKRKKLPRKMKHYSLFSSGFYLRNKFSVGSWIL